MTKTPLTDLQQAAAEVADSRTSQEKFSSLNKAFALFSKETEKLENAYNALKEQFKAVNLELKETNQKLQKKVSELDLLSRYHHNILNNLSQGILFIDLKGNLTTYNPAAEEILQVNTHAALFNPFWEIFDDNLFGFSMREAIESKEAPSHKFTSLTLQDKKVKELEISTSFVLYSTQSSTEPQKEEEKKEKKRNIRSEREWTQGLIILVRDITEIRRLQHLANRNSRMKELGEMAAMLAHEIRNPLGGIKGFASLLQRDLKENPEQRRLANYIVEGTDALNKLVTTVLHYARPLQLHFESIRLATLLDDLHRHIEADTSIDHQIKVEMRILDDTIVAPIDPNLFKSALLNLVMNAIQASPEKGIVVISLDQNKNQAIIQVSDKGTGISPENMEKIFTPFFTTKTDGNGFGLAETHKVIEAHCGTIEVSSQLGEGTSFIIKLPNPTFLVMKQHLTQNLESAAIP